MTADKPRTFLVSIALTGLVMAVAVVVINVVVDPYWRFDLVNIPGFNAQRSEFPNETRMAKAGIVCRIRPASIVMGTSRVEVGMDPNHPGWRKFPQPTYNLAMAGSGIKEVSLTFQHAVHASPKLRVALIDLDFLMFNAFREASAYGTEILGFDQGRLLLSPSDSCLRSFLHDFNSLLGIKALKASFATVTRQMSEADRHDTTKSARWISLFNRNGMRDNVYGFELLHSIGGARRMFGTNQEIYYARRVWRPLPEQRYCFTRNGKDNTFDIFRELVRFARRSGTDVRFFISPTHARLMLAIQDAGLWPQYEDWKRGVVEVVAEESRDSGKPAFPVWDFSGFNMITMEKVPADGDLTSTVRGFWEPSHFKRWTGDLMLDVMLDHRDQSRPIPADFGKLLTPANIEAWLAQTRAAGRAYERAEPEEAALVHKVVDDTLQDTDGSNCGFDLDAIRAGAAALQRGDNAAAEQAFARARQIHEADKRRHAELGVPYRETKFEAQLARARAGLEIGPALADWRAYQMRASARLAKGDYSGAVDDFGHAIRNAPPSAALHYMRATALLKDRNPTAAIKDFERALEIDKKNPTLISLLRQTRIIASNPAAFLRKKVDPAESARLQAAAEERRKSADLAGAIELYGQAIELNPLNMALYYLRGAALMQSGEPAAAIKDFDLGLQLDKDNSALLQLRRQAELVASNPAAFLRKKVDPAESARLQAAAEERRKSADLAGAIELYGRAIDLNPLNVALYFLRGTALLQSGKPQAAAADFEIGLKIDPDNVTLRSLLDQARAAPSKAAPLVDSTSPPPNPALAAYLHRQADAKRAHGDLPGAIRDYSAAIRAGPPNTALHYLRGTARLAAGDRSGAAEDFEIGLKLDPNNAALRNLLSQARAEPAPPIAAPAPAFDATAAAELQGQGDTKRMAGDFAGAIRDYSEAIRIGPPNTALHYLRGTARLAMDDRSGAVEDFEIALKMEPGNPALKVLLTQAQTAPVRHPTSVSESDPKIDVAAAAALQRQGDRKRVAGDLAGAIQDYGEAIRIGPPNTALHYLRGTARLAMGDRDGAAEDFELGLKLEPYNSALRDLLVRARTITVQQTPVPAAPVFDVAAANELQKMAQAKRAAGDLAGAIRDYDEAIRIGPPNTALHFLRGTARLELGDKSGAAQDFEAGLKLDPQNTTLQQLFAQSTAPPK
jgi:tetratricopeptide (TPR) repeat protein